MSKNKQIRSLQVETYNVVSYHDLRRLTEEVYGKSFDIQQHYQSPNGSLIYIGEVSANPWGTEEENQSVRDYIKAWVEDDESEDIDEESLFWDLCYKGYVQPGEYRVHVSW